MHVKQTMSTAWVLLAVGVPTGCTMSTCDSGLGVSEPAAPSGVSAVERPVAPAFLATDLDGVAVTNATLAGKVVVLDFWATWCMPCIASMPKIQAIADDYAANPDVVVLAVQVDDQGDAREFMARNGFRLRTLPNARDMAIAFSVSGLPTYIVLDREGRVAFRMLGMMGEGEAKLRSAVRDALDAG